MNKHSRIWSLQEAKAKFSEVVRRAQAEGPQTITLHGKPVVRVDPIGVKGLSADDTGKSLVDILSACPAKGILGKLGVPRIHAKPRKIQFP